MCGRLVSAGRSRSQSHWSHPDPPVLPVPRQSTAFACTRAGCPASADCASARVPCGETCRLLTGRESHETPASAPRESGRAERSEAKRRHYSRPDKPAEGPNATYVSRTHDIRESRRIGIRNSFLRYLQGTAVCPCHPSAHPSPVPVHAYMPLRRTGQREGSFRATHDTTHWHSCENAPETYSLV